MIEAEVAVEERLNEGVNDFVDASEASEILILFTPGTLTSYHLEDHFREFVRKGEEWEDARRRWSVRGRRRR